MSEEFPSKPGRVRKTQVKETGGHDSNAVTDGETASEGMRLVAPHLADLLLRIAAISRRVGNATLPASQTIAFLQKMQAEMDASLGAFAKD